MSLRGILGQSPLWFSLRMGPALYQDRPTIWSIATGKAEKLLPAHSLTVPALLPDGTQVMCTHLGHLQVLDNFPEAHSSYGLSAEKDRIIDKLAPVYEHCLWIWPDLQRQIEVMAFFGTVACFGCSSGRVIILDLSK